MFPTKFRVNWLLGLGKRKIDFQDGHHGHPTKFGVNWPFCSGEAKKIFKMAAMVAILDFQLERF